MAVKVLHEFDILKESSSDYLLRTSRQFAIYTCAQRAIPYIGDGLKPSQRIALWVIRNRADKMKTFSLAGAMAEQNLYVHGEKSATDMISQLAAPYINNIALLDGIGNFGSREKPATCGAPRYTFVRRNKFLEQVVLVDLDILPMEPNYDDSSELPSHFLPLIPIALLNGVFGIAVGWSTNILAHPFLDLVNACIAVLDGKPCPKLMPHYARYDLQIADLGEQQYRLSGAVQMIDGATVLISEVPPEISLNQVREHLNELEDQGAIVSYRDNSTSSVSITVKFKPGVLAELTPAAVLDLFKLHQKETQRIVVLNWDTTKPAIWQYNSAETVIGDFVAWRLTWYARRYEVLLDKLRHENTFWRCLRRLWEKDLPRSLKGFKGRADLAAAIESLTVDLKPTPDIVTRLAGLPTHRWTGDGIAECDEKLAGLEAAITANAAILGSPEKLQAVYRSELVALKKIKWTED